MCPFGGKAWWLLRLLVESGPFGECLVFGGQFRLDSAANLPECVLLKRKNPHSANAKVLRDFSLRQKVMPIGHWLHGVHTIIAPLRWLLPLLLQP